MNINEAVELALNRMPAPQVTNFLKKMSVSHQTLRTWRNGENIPSPENAVRLAELAGIEPAALVLDVLQEAAKTEDLRSVIAEFKRRLTAAAIALTVALPATLEQLQQCILCKISDRRRQKSGFPTSPPKQQLADSDQVNTNSHQGPKQIPRQAPISHLTAHLEINLGPARSAS